MVTDSFDAADPDGTIRDSAHQDSPDSPTSTDEPITATGERSTTIQEDENGGALPTPEPTDGGAPAP